MRWPFHVGKVARPEEQAAAEPPAPPQRHDWASVAPIQRTIGDIPLTAHSVEFSESLAGSEEPALSLEPLGHHRSPEGPQGIVTGIASPLESYSRSTELIVRPRRRIDASAGIQATAEETESPAMSDAGAAGADEALAPGLLTRALPAVSGEAARVPAVASRLTDAGKVELGPLRPVQRAPETPVRADPGVTPAADQPLSAPPSGTRLSLGLSRRHGLGAPIRGADPASLQRFVAPPPRVDEHASRTPPSSGPPPASEPQASVVVPPLPPARRQTAARPSSEESGTGTTAGATEAGKDIAPTVREVPEADAPADRITAPAEGEAVAPLQRMAWIPVPTRPSMADPLRLPALQRATPTVPLTSARPPLTTVRPAGDPERVSLPGEQAPSALGATLAPMPLPATPPAPPMPWSPSGVAAASRPAPARTQGPLVWNLQRVVPAGEAPDGPSSPDVGPRPGEAVPASESPAMASAPAPAPLAGSAPAAESGPRPGESAATVAGAPGPGSAPAPHGEKELDELAHVLFPRLMSLVRFDLLIERERAGLVTDLR